MVGVAERMIDNFSKTKAPPALNLDQPKGSAKAQGLRKTGSYGRNEEGKKMSKLDKITLYVMKIMLVHNANDIRLKAGSRIHREMQSEIRLDGDSPCWRGYPIIDSMQDDDRVEIEYTLVDNSNFAYCVIFIIDDLEGMEI